MSNNRKVQGDIDRLLKKTAEGLEAYDQLYEKFDGASNAGAKERLEGDLKKEIKKLQRQREQIKGYISSVEVKDTKLLESFRKKIEEKMEAFKTCEREMKTKAFSKEGLASAANEANDSPRARTAAWLKNAIEEGRKTIDLLDYEVQRGGNGRNNRKSKQRSDVHQRMDKLSMHFFKWEALLRLVINEEVDPDEVDELRSHVEEVLSEDCDLAALSDMEMYEPFDVPDLKVKSAAEEEPTAEEKKAVPSVKSSAKKTPPASVTAKNLSPSATSVASVKKAVSTPSPQADASAHATPGSFPASQAHASPMSMTERSEERAVEDPAAMLDAMDDMNDDTFGDDAMDGAAAGTLEDMADSAKRMAESIDPNEWQRWKSEMKERQAAQLAGAKASPAAAGGVEAAGEDAAGGSTAGSPEDMASATNKLLANEWEKRKVEAAKKRSQPSPATTPTAAVASPPVSTQRASAPAESPSPPMQPQAQGQTAVPASGTSSTKYDAKTTLGLLDVSLANLNHTLDVERQRPYEPPNAIEPIPYFPQEVHPVLACRETYRHFDEETLFFICYYHQKSYQQYFASKELKAHSFRYHTELRRWYQRREKPLETTPTSERGAYIYFDYEDTWHKQPVDDFTFEYKYLEDELS